MRVLVRRERPHPGAQMDASEERDGYRYQALATNTTVGQLEFPEALHRAHARVEDRTHKAQDAGLGRLPSKLFAVNDVWLELALTAADLLAWTQTILLLGAPGRRAWLRLTRGWP
jgi:Transposase DDE domain group 1